MSDLEWVRRDGVGRWEAESGGGSPPSVEWVGPFVIAFDTPSIMSDNVLLVALDAGTLVWRIMPIVTQAWDAAGGLQILGAAEGSLLIWKSNARLDGETVTQLGVHPLEAVNPSGFRAEAGNGLYAFIDGGDTPLTGSIDLYALIGVPA